MPHSEAKLAICIQSSHNIRTNVQLSVLELSSIEISPNPDRPVLLQSCPREWISRPRGEQKGGLLRDKFGGQFGKSIRHPVGIAEDDFDVAAIDETLISFNSGNLTLCQCAARKKWRRNGIRF